MRLDPVLHALVEADQIIERYRIGQVLDGLIQVLAAGRKQSAIVLGFLLADLGTWLEQAEQFAQALPAETDLANLVRQMAAQPQIKTIEVGKHQAVVARLRIGAQ